LLAVGERCVVSGEARPARVFPEVVGSLGVLANADAESPAWTQQHPADATRRYHNATRQH